MDTQTSLKTTGTSHRYQTCSDKSKELTPLNLARCYVDYVLSFADCNGNAPTFAEYSRGLAERLTDSFGIDMAEMRHITSLFANYGNYNGNGLDRLSPVCFENESGKAVKVKLQRGRYSDRDSIVNLVLSELGENVQKSIAEYEKRKSPTTAKSFTRIDSDEDWRNRVYASMMKRL